MIPQATRDYLQLHLVVFLWGFTAIFGMLISLPALELVFYRTLISAVAMGALLLAGKKSMALSRAGIIKTTLTGSLIGIHWILFFVAARVSTISVSLAGLATLSLWTSLLEPLITRKKVKMFEVLLGLMALVGIVIIFKVEFQYALGLVLAILAALLASFFSVINAVLVRHHSHLVITFYEMTGAMLSTLLFFPFYSYYVSQGGHLHLALTGWDALWLLLLSLVCTVYAYSQSVRLMQRIPAFALNLVVNLEPVYGIILAVLIFGDTEKMEPGFYLGTLILVLSVLIYPWINRRYRRKALTTDILR